MYAEMITTLFHPGDLSLGDWVRFLGMFLAFIVLPIAIIGFVIFKVVSGHSGGGAGSKSKVSITRTNGRSRK